MLVAGGGDSALEAALACAAEPGSVVTLSYRGEAFSRVKPKNRDALQKAQAEGRLRVLLQSNVQAIDTGCVTIECDGKPLRIGNDAVIVCAGGVLPTPLLKEIGVQVETKFGSA